MALEFICSSEIVDGKNIALPRESLNGRILRYCIDKEKKEIVFFYLSNGERNMFAFNTWDVPRKAREIGFGIYKKYNQDILEAPVFYDSKGEILKIGNR